MLHKKCNTRRTHSFPEAEEALRKENCSKFKIRAHKKPETKTTVAEAKPVETKNETKPGLNTVVSEIPTYISQAERIQSSLQFYATFTSAPTMSKNAIGIIKEESI